MFKACFHSLCHVIRRLEVPIAVFNDCDIALLFFLHNTQGLFPVWRRGGKRALSDCAYCRRGGRTSQIPSPFRKEGMSIESLFPFRAREHLALCEQHSSASPFLCEYTSILPRNPNSFCHVSKKSACLFLYRFYYCSSSTCISIKRSANKI